MGPVGHLKILLMLNPETYHAQLDQKIILVTGGASGVGREIAVQCARLGAKGVLVTDKNKVGGVETANFVKKIGRQTGAKTSAQFVEADLTREEDCRAVVRACDEVFGQIDGVVNGAGRGTRGNLENTSVSLWDEMADLHVRAPFILIQEASKIMRREKNGGSIINIGSINAHGGDPEILAYSVAKGALMTLTKSAAFALRKDNIRLYCLNIGWTATEQEHNIQMENGQPENWLELADKTMPLGRLARPNDISPMVTFLLSDQARMVTGSIIEWDQKMISGPYGK